MESKEVVKRVPEVVVYLGPPKRAKDKQRTPEVIKSDETKPVSSGRSHKSDVITMHRARFEVHKFGIQGFHKQKKEEANVQLAITLGAKPLKKKYFNYKEYIAMRQEEKRIAMEQRQIKGKTNSMKTRKPSNKSKKPNNNSKKLSNNSKNPSNKTKFTKRTKK